MAIRQWRSRTLGVGMFSVVVGSALIVWGVLAGRAAPYVLGILLAPAAVVFLTVRALRAPGPGRSQRRGPRLPLALVVAITVTAILLALPGALRTLHSRSGVVWSTDPVSGQPHGHHGHLFFVADGSGDQDSLRMTALDGASGSFKWSASPERIYAVHGGYLLVDAEAITEYRFTGETKWQADLGASGIVRAHAQAEGHTVVSICPNDLADAPECEVVGLDAAGERAWQRTQRISGPDLQRTTGISEVTQVPTLPTAAVFATHEPRLADERVVLLESTTGQVLMTERLAPKTTGLARRFHSYGDHLLASQALGDKVTVTAFSLATGEKSWQTDVPCAQECQVHDVAAMDESDAAVSVRPEGDDRPVAVVDLADGQTTALDHNSEPESSTRLWSLHEARPLRLTWSTQEIAAYAPQKEQPLWREQVRGEDILHVTATGSTVAVVSRNGPGHNPYVGGHGEWVTLLDADDGSVNSATLFPDGGVTVSVVDDGAAVVQQEDSVSLVGTGLSASG